MAEVRPLVIAGIPAHNAEQTIAQVVEEAQRYVHRVVVCDDGSVDRTGERAAGRGAEVIRHDRQKGYGAALATLFRRGRELQPDVLVTLDAGSPQMLADIPRLVIPILKGEADVVVVGSRGRGAGREAVVSRGEQGLMLLTQRARGASSDAKAGVPWGVRAYSRRAVEAVMPTQRGPEASTEILVKAEERGLAITEAPIER